MKLAADTSMLRDRPIRDAFDIIAHTGYQYLELAPRPDLLPVRQAPTATKDRLDDVRAAVQATGVDIASLFVVYAWADPDEWTRRDAVTHWHEAIRIAVDLGCSRLNTEFAGSLDQHDASLDALERSLQDIVPQLEREGLALAIEPHPGDFIESAFTGIDLVRGVGSTALRYLHCVPHSYYLGGDTLEVIAYAKDLLDHVHIADTFDPRRTILNPPQPLLRIHQHFDIGQGEIAWTEVFAALAEAAFDGIMTVSVFMWEERVEGSLRHNLAEIRGYLEP